MRRQREANAYVHMYLATRATTRIRGADKATLVNRVTLRGSTGAKVSPCTTTVTDLQCKYKKSRTTRRDETPLPFVSAGRMVATSMITTVSLPCSCAIGR